MATKKRSSRKYGRAAGKSVKSAMHKEKRGELPKSFPLSPSSRYRAWTGQQVLDHRAKMQVLAAEQAVAEKRPQPPQFAAAKQKIKKQKLHPPVAKARQRESA